MNRHNDEKQKILTCFYLLQEKATPRINVRSIDFFKQFSQRKKREKFNLEKRFTGGLFHITNAMTVLCVECVAMLS